MDLYRYMIHNKSINLNCDLSTFAKDIRTQVNINEIEQFNNNKSIIQ
jgi:hypothetical protein